MARATFSLAVSINAPLEQVKQQLLGIDEMQRYHPFITHVTELAADTSQFGTPGRRFAVTDHMRVGPIPIAFTYRVTATIDAEGNIYNEALQSPGVHLVTAYCCTAENGAIHIAERCDIDAPRLLINFVRRQAYAAHQTLLAGIKRHLEGSSI